MRWDDSALLFMFSCVMLSTCWVFGLAQLPSTTLKNVDNLENVHYMFTWRRRLFTMYESWREMKWIWIPKGHLHVGRETICANPMKQQIINRTRNQPFKVSRYTTERPQLLSLQWHSFIGQGGHWRPCPLLVPFHSGLYTHICICLYIYIYLCIYMYYE